MKLIETLINGLSMGSTYAMIALGYTMVYGIAKMLNFAHGDVIMAGGYMLFITMTAIGHPLLGLLAAVLFCVVLGVTVEKVAYKPLRGASPLAVLITAIGVSKLLQSTAQIIFGTAPKTVNIADGQRQPGKSYDPRLHSGNPGLLHSHNGGAESVREIHKNRPCHDRRVRG